MCVGTTCFRFYRRCPSRLVNVIGPLGNREVAALFVPAGCSFAYRRRTRFFLLFLRPYNSADASQRFVTRMLPSRFFCNCLQFFLEFLIAPLFSFPSLFLKREPIDFSRVSPRVKWLLYFVISAVEADQFFYRRLFCACKW